MSRFNPGSQLRTNQFRASDGSAALPSVGFVRERLGWYRNGAGRLAAGVSSFRAIEITKDDTFVRSNALAGAHAAPLAMSRANGASADGLETRFDIYDNATPVGRIASYRASATSFGMRFYVHSTALHAAPSLIIDPSMDVALGRDLRVTRYGSAGSRFGVGVTASDLVSVGATAMIQSVDADAFRGLWLQAGGAHSQEIFFANATTIGGAVTAGLRVLFSGRAIGGLGSEVGDASIFTSGAQGKGLTLGSFNEHKIHMGLDYLTIQKGTGSVPFYFGVGGARVGRLGINTLAPDGNIHIIPSFNEEMSYMGATASRSTGWLFGNHNVAASATALGVVGFTLNPPSFGGNLNDLTIMTYGAAGGRVRFGTNNTGRMIIGTTGNVSIASTEYSSRLGIKQSTETWGSGLTLYRPSSDAHRLDLWSGDNGDGFIGVNVGPVWSIRGVTAGGVNAGSLVPLQDQTYDVGVDGARIRRLYASHYVSIGSVATPVYMLQLSGDSAGKPGTSTWTVVSDPRTKVTSSIRNYQDGLAKIEALRPIVFRYNGAAGTPANAGEFIGLDASAARAAAPELVRTSRMPLTPDGPPEDVDSIDYHGLFLLFINAFREMGQRVRTLEARNNAPGSA